MGGYNPSLEEMIEANACLIDDMKISGIEKDYLLKNGVEICNMMNNLNAIDGNMRYEDVFYLVAAVYLRNF